MLLQKGFAFGFKKNVLGNHQIKNIKDVQVFNTIHQIIKDFFDSNGNETVLLYHCDTSDNKQLIRSKLFDKWQRMVAETSLERHSVEVFIEDNGFYLGFITLLQNPFINELKSEFDAFSYYIIQPKGE